MEARFKRGDVVYLNEDFGKQFRKKYKVIEFYLGDIPDDLNQAKVIKGGKVEGKTNPDHNYMIEPLTDGASRIVVESQIQGIAE